MQDHRLKVLITGANGFVGCVLNKVLVQRHFLVVPTLRDIKNISSEINAIEIGEIDEKTDWSSALSDVDVVIHLAARVHVMNDNADDPLAEFQSTNVHGTSNLARQASEAGVRRFVYVSSVKVNGEYTDNKPFIEADLPNPQDPYAISKWQAEQALHEISRETCMELVVVRPPLVYGAGVKANFYNLLELVGKRLPLPLGSIRNRRSMIYVANLVDALILCATHPKAVGQTYLLSDGKEASTPELIGMISQAMQQINRVYPFPVPLLRLVARLCGKSSVVDRLTQSLVIDNSKIMSELDWQPPYSMQQGLQITVNWFLQMKGGQ